MNGWIGWNEQHKLSIATNKTVRGLLFEAIRTTMELVSVLDTEKGLDTVSSSDDYLSKFCWMNGLTLKCMFITCMLGAWQEHIYQNQVKSYLDTEINMKEYFGSINGMFWYDDELKKEFNVKSHMKLT